MAEEDNNFHNFSLYSSANFQDADETRPAGSYMEAVGGGNDAIQTLVNHSFQRHISEVVPSNSPMLVGMTGQTSNWRKRLREMMVRQNEQVLSFLLKPSSEHLLASGQGTPWQSRPCLTRDPHRQPRHQTPWP